MQFTEEIFNAAVESHVQQSIVAVPELAGLDKEIKADTERFNGVIGKLDTGDMEFVKSYLNKKMRLTTGQLDYMYLHGMKDAFAICEAPSTLIQELEKILTN